jgi:hypothetical protein
LADCGRACRYMVVCCSTSRMTERRMKSKKSSERIHTAQKSSCALGAATNFWRHGGNEGQLHRTLIYCGARAMCRGGQFR